MSYNQNNRVRTLWQNFVKTSSGKRNATEHKIRAETAKATDDDAKAGIAKDIQEKAFKTLRAQWQTVLDKENLAWMDMTEEEKEDVTKILGEVPEHEVSDSSSTSPEIPQINPLYLHPVAPSFSSSTRSTNISSASSYAVVSPHELYSEDDGDSFMSPLMASSNDTSDEDEVMIQPVQFHPGRLGVPHNSNGWSSSESLGAASLLHPPSSSEFSAYSRPLASGFAQNAFYGRVSSANQSAASLFQSDFEKPSPPAPPKAKTARNPYIGPHLDDPHEPISEAEDFERFKMQTRMEKIIEFHQEAALLEIKLSFSIYRTRKEKEKNGEVSVSPLVLEHQKNMVQLQSQKEEERKGIVKRERTKRRSELQRRPGRSNTLMAPTPSVALSTNPPWLNTLEGHVSSQSLGGRFDIDNLLRRGSQDGEESNVQEIFGQLFPSESSVPPQQRQNGSSGPPPSRSAFLQSRQGFSSASMQGVQPGSSAQSQPQRKRRPSDVKVVNKAGGVGKGRPSPFGEDDSGDDDDDAEDEEEEEEEDEEEEEEPPTARDPNAFMTNALASQLQNDFGIQQSMARFGLLGDVSPPLPAPPSSMMMMQQQQQQMWNPSSSSRLMEQSPITPTPVVPTPSPAGTKVPSGWTTRKNGAGTPLPRPSSSASSAFSRSTFGMSDPSPAPSPAPVVAPTPPPVSKGFFSKGKQTPAQLQAQLHAQALSQTQTPAQSQSQAALMMMMNNPNEPQPVWGQPNRKMSSSPADVPVAPTPAPPPPPPSRQGAATPAPAPAPTPTPGPAAAAGGKKANKKQRQAALKKGGLGAAASSSVMEDPEPTSTPIIPSVSSHSSQASSYLSSSSKLAFEDPSSVTEPNDFAEPPSMFAASSSFSRMMPSMGRGSSTPVPTPGVGMNGGFNGFSSWDIGGGDSASTPRPPSRIPAHLQRLQHLQQQEPSSSSSSLMEGWGDVETNNNSNVELFGVPLKKTAMEQLAAAAAASGGGTIRASSAQRGANGNGNAATKVWNLWGSEEEPATMTSSKAFAGNPRIPGGYDLNGNTEVGGGDGDDDDGWGDGGWGDGDGDGGGGGGGGGEFEPAAQPQSFWQPQKKTTATVNNSKMTAAQGLRRLSPTASASPIPAPAPTPPVPVVPVTKPATPAPAPPAPVPKPATPVPATTTGKKGKGKKGKGNNNNNTNAANNNAGSSSSSSKKVTIEEVPDDDDDKNSKLDHLPVDSRVIFVEAGETVEKSDGRVPTPSSFGFGSAASSNGSQSDLSFGGGGSEKAWGAGGGGGSGFGWGAAAKPPTVAWGTGKDKGKGKMGMGMGGESAATAGVAANPTIQNLKRGKLGAAGNLF